MRIDMDFKKQLFIVASGVAISTVSTLVALTVHGSGRHLHIGVLWAILMSALYYVWFTITTMRLYALYLISCSVTAYVLGVLEVVLMH